MKRYRRPKVEEGQIKMQMGSVYGEIDICIFYGDNIPRRDRALIVHTLGPSLTKELDARGYDLETLRFSIEKKKVTK